MYCVFKNNMPYSPTCRLVGHKADVIKAVIASDVIVTGSADASMKIWDVNTRQAINTVYSQVGAVSDFVFKDDILFSGGEYGMSFHDTREKQSFKPITTERVTAVGIDRHSESNANGRTLVYSTLSGQLVFFDLLLGREVARVQVHKSLISSLSFSADGSVVATAGLDGNLRLVSAINFDIIHSYGSYNQKPCLFSKILDASEVECLQRQSYRDEEGTRTRDLNTIDSRTSLAIGALYGDGIFRLYSTRSRLEPVLNMKHIQCGNSSKNFAVASDYVAFPSSKGSVSFWRGGREVYRSPVIHADDCSWVEATENLLVSCGYGVDSSAVVWTRTSEWEEPDVSFDPVFPQVVGL